MKCYYIHESVFSTSNDLPIGPRIKVYNFTSNYPVFENADGPYKSLKDLRKNSIIYKKLLKNDPKRAHKICDKDFHVVIKEMVPIYDRTQEVLGDGVFNLLHHIVSGKTKDKRSFGVHHFNPKLHRIEKIVNEPNSKGVWEAIISVFNTNTKIWNLKNTPSTFFPSHWSKGTLLLKLEEAFLNKRPISESKFIGITDCGIEVVFIIKLNNIVAAYPIW